MQIAVFATKYRATMAQSQDENVTAVPVMRAPSRSAAQDSEQLFELHAHLFDDLLTLAHVDASLFATELVARATDGETLLVQQRADLADDDDVLALVVAAIAAALDRLELREL